MGTEHLTGRKCIMAATRPPQVPGVIHNNHATEFQQKNDPATTISPQIGHC